MKKFVLILLLAFIANSAQAQSCEDGSLYPDAEKACGNYFLVKGKWKLKYTRVKSDCSRYVRYPLQKNENINIRIKFEGWTKELYEEDDRDLIDFDDRDTANFYKIDGTRWTWPMWFQTPLQNSSLETHWEIYEQACNLPFYCETYNSAYLKFNRKKKTLSGRTTHALYYFDNLVCKATYKIQGTRK